jgi:hypothetical protein
MDSYGLICTRLMMHAAAWGEGPRPVKGLQKALQAMIDGPAQKRAADNSEVAGPADAARILSAAAKGSRLWLVSLPRTAATLLYDGHMQQAVRLRLGLKPEDDLPDICPGCRKRLTPEHCHGCGVMVRKGMLQRHNAVVRELARLARSAGCTVYIEWRSDVDLDHPLEEGRSRQFSRPDLYVEGHNLFLGVDVTVSHPALPTYLLLKSAKVPLAAAESRERLKEAQYADRLRALGITFMPFSLETLGAWGPKAVRVLRLLAEQAVAHGKNSIP